MADQWTGGQHDPGERWNVNLPAVVGVVFVFMLGVVIWVIASSDDDEPTTGSSMPATGSLVTTTLVPPTTSPLPMPATSVPATALPPTTSPPAATTAPATSPPAIASTLVPTTQAPPATAPPPATADPGTGDLGVPGHPIQRPPCDGGYITVLASAIGGEATAAGMDAVLDDYPGSNYLRTDTCPSLTQSSNGQPIYVVYFGPFAVDSDACQARAAGPDGAYVRRLSNDLTPQHSVACG